MSVVLANVPQPHGGALRPFVKGQSGNPGGRPKGLMSCVRRKCGRNGAKLVDALFVLAFGSAEDRRAFFGEPVEVSTKDRRAAIESLLDRGFGRPQVLDDDLPFMPEAGDSGPQIIINLPRPPNELAGRTVVTGAIRVESQP